MLKIKIQLFFEELTSHISLNLTFLYELNINSIYITYNMYI